MTTVYAVSSGEYSDYGVGPLFKTYEDAKKAALTYGTVYGDPFIEEFELYDNYEDYMSRRSNQETIYKISAYINKKDGTVDIMSCSILGIDVVDSLQDQATIGNNFYGDKFYKFTTYLSRNHTTEELIGNYFLGEKYSDTSNEAKKQLIKIVADRFAKFRSEYEEYFM